MHGKRDTYNMRKANHFLWETVGAEPTGMNKNDYKNMYAFWKGMNEFRMSEYGKVFRQSKAVPEGYFQWILPDQESMLGYIVDEKVFVLLNAGDTENEFNDVSLPEGKWKLIATNREVNINGVKSEKKLKSLTGGKTMSFTMKPESLRIWVKE